MTALKGLGDCVARTTDLVGGPQAQGLFPYPNYEFEFAQEADVQELLAYRAGKRQIEESYESSLKTTLKLKTQISNWQMLGLSLGQFERTFTGFVLPTIKRTTVPANGIVADADIVAGNLNSVTVAIESYGAWGQAGRITRSAAAPTAGQVQVTAGTLTFNAAQAGAPIMYVCDKTYTAAKAYGGAGTLSTINTLEFFGQLYDTSAQEAAGGTIWIPKIQRSARPTLTFNGGIVEIETSWNCLSVPGWAEPYMIVDGHSLVP